MLDAVLTVVDAKHVTQHLDDQKPEGVVNEAVQQIAFADKVRRLGATDACTRGECRCARAGRRPCNVLWGAARGVGCRCKRAWRAALMWPCAAGRCAGGLCGKSIAWPPP
jgi:hypothetical protein